MLKRTTLFFLTIFLSIAALQSGNPQNYLYAIKDTSQLSMDVYFPTEIQQSKPCMIFVFGGGFFKGSKSEKVNAAFCKAIADSGLVVAAIDYRLGMKNNNSKGLNAYFALTNSIKIAREDLLSATEYLIKNADLLHINTNQIFICGSSAGALTVLDTDYYLSNNSAETALPTGFRYRGVISFAGGLLTNNGSPQYKNEPAPTLFFHGMEDKIVIYDRNKKFRVGFFGSNALVEYFQKNNDSYSIYRYKDMGHEISFLPMIYNKKEVMEFINSSIQNVRFKNDSIINNPDLPKSEWGKMKLKDLYKNNNW